MRRCWLRPGVLFAIVLLGSLLVPLPAMAGTCGDLIPDVGACVDATSYTWWKSLAVGAWNLDRTLLIGAYQVNQFRWTILEVLFLSAYDALVDLIGPLLGPVATLALTIGLLALIARPALGRTRLVNLRQVVVLVLLGTTVLTQLGPWVIELESARVDLLGALFGDVSAQIPQRIFGARATTPDMLPVRELYPASCHGQTLSRGGDGGRTLADAAAALLWADAIDIHCPEESGTSYPELPARWTNPTAADYAYNGDLGDVSDAHIRAAYTRKIQAGFWRAVYALIPSLIALMEELIQCAFAFSLIVLALAAPVMWLYSYFQETMAGLLRLASGAGQVVKVSLTTSFLLSLLVSALLAATGVNDATAYTAFACFGLIGMFVIGRVAARTLLQSIETASASVEAATGYNPTEPAQMAAAGIGTVASAGVAVATGGASLAVTGAALGFAAVDGLAAAMRGSRAPAPAQPAAPGGESEAPAPAGGTPPPAEGTPAPTEGTPPAEGTAPPAEGVTPPAEGVTPPAQAASPGEDGAVPVLVMTPVASAPLPAPSPADVPPTPEVPPPAPAPGAASPPPAPEAVPPTPAPEPAPPAPPLAPEAAPAPPTPGATHE